MSEIISAAVLLILIMDPLGNLPIFMSVLKHTGTAPPGDHDPPELLIALLVMFIFLLPAKKFRFPICVPKRFPFPAELFCS